MRVSRWKDLGTAILLLVFFPSPSFSQDGQRPYLTEATLYLAVDGWADIWLNGIPIRDNQPSTPETKGFQIVHCLPKHLCYFQNENVLAVENANAYRIQPPLNNQIGLAYILQLRFSDGSEETLSSNDTANHKAFYIPGRETAEPGGWHRLSFQDENWPLAQSIEQEIPGVATLADPANHSPIQFLSAGGSGFRAQFPGERHLYRRRFTLDISPNPNCLPVKVEEQVMPEKRIPIATSTPMPASWPSPVFSSQPVREQWPVKAATPTPFPVAVVGATVTSTPVPVFPSPLATPPPKTIIQPQNEKTLARESHTSFGVETRVDPILENAPPVVAKIARTPTVVFGPSTGASQAQTIVFEDRTANIYLSFADGPGLYSVEVFDSGLHHLRNLYEKRVVAQSDDWVGWDGKDDEGRDVSAGQFVVVLSKDGKPLNKIIVVKSSTP